MRGRNRNGGGGGGGGGNGGGGGGGGGGGRGPNPLTRSYESNGPDVKIRGTASTIADKYVQLSRDALTSGDPVAAENYMQHAEHYYRMLAAAQAQYQPNQTFVRADAEEFNDGDYDEENGETQSSSEQNGQAGQNSQPAHNSNGAPQNNGQQQPRFNGDRNRQNGNVPNGNVQGGNVQGGQAAPAGQNNGERRFDRNERRPDRDRSADRPERAERQPRADRGSDEQPFVGDLPSFITGDAPVRAEPVKAATRTARQPAPAVEPELEPVVTTASEAPSVTPEAGDDEGEGRVAPRGRRRRFGRAGRTGAEGEADAAPAPETAGD